MLHINSSQSADSITNCDSAKSARRQWIYQILVQIKGFDAPLNTEIQSKQSTNTVYVWQSSRPRVYRRSNQDKVKALKPIRDCGFTSASGLEECKTFSVT